MRYSMKYYRYFLIFIIISLSACGGGDMSDLTAKVAQIEARENPQVPPIPPFRIIPNFFYPTETDRLRDPFESFIKSREEKKEEEMQILSADIEREDCLRPDPYRIRMGLEKMPLDNLNMIGTLNDEKNNIWGIVVSSSDGITYKVKVGDFMGDNYGEIINITPNKIELLELYPDGSGCFVNRNSSITLIE